MGTLISEAENPDFELRYWRRTDFRLRIVISPFGSPNLVMTIMKYNNLCFSLRYSIMAAESSINMNLMYRKVDIAI